jgi:hypothetical protein
MLGMYSEHDFDRITTVTSPGFNIFLILIRCLLALEKTSCQEFGRIFLHQNYDYDFLYIQATSGVGDPPEKYQVQSGLFHSMHISMIVP